MNIYDNAVPKDLFKELQEQVLSHEFPWYWSGTAYSKNIKPNLWGYSFAHTAIVNGQHNSAIASLAESAVKILVGHTGEVLTRIERLRLGLITVAPKTLLHPAHVDYTTPHKTGLLYLNDSDGDTYLYHERYEPDSNLSDYERYLEVKDNLTLKSQITPKENRFFMFDGLHFHNSSTPTKTARRIVINFNYFTT